MKMITRTVIIAVIISAAYLWGCGGSEEKTDKYNLISKSDRKNIKQMCKCVEPIIPLIKKINDEKDSTKALQLLDSLDSRSIEVAGCMQNFERLETKFTDEKFTEQFSLYLREYHPDCAPLFLGIKDEINNKK
jgi:hypothetical protein